MTEVDGGTVQALLPLHCDSHPLHGRGSVADPVLSSLTRELEKKLSDKYIVFLSQRRVLPKPKRNSAVAHKQKRPRSRTLTAVHEKMLEDLVWPSEIVGKRTRVAQDGGKLIRVYVISWDVRAPAYRSASSTPRTRTCSSTSSTPSHPSTAPSPARTCTLSELHIISALGRADFPGSP